MAPPKILPRFYQPRPWVQLLCFKFLHAPDVPQVSQTQHVLSSLSPSLPLLYHLSNSDIYHCMLGPGSHPWFFPCSSSRVNHQSWSHKCPYIPPFFSIVTTKIECASPHSIIFCQFPSSFVPSTSSSQTAGKVDTHCFSWHSEHSSFLWEQRPDFALRTHPPPWDIGLVRLPIKMPTLPGSGWVCPQAGTIQHPSSGIWILHRAK